MLLRFAAVAVFVVVVSCICHLFFDFVVFHFFDCDFGYLLRHVACGMRSYCHAPMQHAACPIVQFVQLVPGPRI